jgi:hypothetical protein
MSIRSSLLTIVALQLFAVCLLATVPRAALAETCDDAIDTNRPSFMESPLIVPPLSLQLENGTGFVGYRGNQATAGIKSTYDIPETQVRIGIFDKTEFQVYVPNYFLIHSPGDNTAYVSDITDLGIKTHLGKENAKFNVAVVAGMLLPTGSRFIWGSGVEPVVRIPWGYNLNSKWAIEGQQSLHVINGGRDVQWEPDALVSRSIGSKAGVFIEYYGIITHGEAPENIIHFGAVYKVTHNQQFDVDFGFGMNKAAPSAFVGAGYSFRLCRAHK